MNKAEIMTLRNNGVKQKDIRLAIMAGKLSGILMAADRQIAQAEDFNNRADWTEMLRIMEGTLEQEVDHRADDRRSKRKDRFPPID